MLEYSTYFSISKLNCAMFTPMHALAFSCLTIRFSFCCQTAFLSKSYFQLISTDKWVQVSAILERTSYSWCMPKDILLLCFRLCCVYWEFQNWLQIRKRYCAGSKISDWRCRVASLRKKMNTALMSRTKQILKLGTKEWMWVVFLNL